MKDYTRSLIYEDTALARQIEEYLRKKEITEKMKEDEEEARKLDLNSEHTPTNNDDYLEYLGRLEQEKKLDKEIYNEQSEFS